MTSVTYQPETLPPVSVSHFSLAMSSLVWLSHQCCFLIYVEPPPQYSVPSEKALCLSAADFVDVFDMPAPARWDTAGSLSNGRAAGMIHIMPELQPDLKRSKRGKASV